MKKQQLIILAIWALYIIVPLSIWGSCFMNPNDWATITIFFTWHTISTLAVTAFVIWIMLKDDDSLNKLEQEISKQKVTIAERDAKIAQLKLEKETEITRKNHEIERLKRTQP
jgi:hypothetical protein